MEDLMNFLDDNEEDTSDHLVNISADNIFSDRFTELELKEKPPSTGNWCLPALYSMKSNENTLKWQIGYDESTKKIIWTCGYVNSDKIQLYTEDIVPNNLHKTYVSKAYQSAKQKFDDKIKGGYYLDINNPNRNNILNLGFPKPMLAVIMKLPGINEVTGKPVKGSILQFPVTTQAKLDGERNMARLNISEDGNREVMFVSRQNLERKFLYDIKKEVLLLYDYLPDNIYIDGEIYAHNMTFEEIASICGRTKEPHPKENLLSFYIFDIFDPNKEYTHDKRLNILNDAYNKFEQDHKKSFKKIVRVACNIANSYEEVLAQFKSYRDLNFEGAMVRQLAGDDTKGKVFKRSLYVHSRTSNLQKLKDSTEIEVEITGVTPCKEHGRDLALFVYRDPVNGVTGTVRPNGKFEKREEWLLYPERVVGKIYTIKCQDKTGKDNFKFPTGVGFKNYNDNVDDEAEAEPKIVEKKVTKPRAKTTKPKAKKTSSKEPKIN